MQLEKEWLPFGVVFWLTEMEKDLVPTRRMCSPPTVPCCKGQVNGGPPSCPHTLSEGAAGNQGPLSCPPVCKLWALVHWTTLSRGNTS